MPVAATLLLPLLLLALAALLALCFARLKSLPVVAMGWILAIFPAAAVGLITWMSLPVLDGQTFTFSIPWIPTLGLSFSLYLDGLSTLFALLVSGIGTLIVIYTGYYFKGEQGVWRFYLYLLLFMGAMLGLVLAGDLITLFVFWEITSITSFLLVAYQYKDASARAGAFKALLITGAGGIALLVGVLLIGLTTGGLDYATILSSREALLASPLYPAIILLIALGAFTKSAQFPFHIWLPGAMSAPTPASAFLHSATMVKAGIYLLARLNPALGDDGLWFWLLSGVGLFTMLAGGYLGFKQNDLKALLAYSTISALGAMVALIGQETSIASKALVVGILAHALYKSALFMLAGIVDHETGTRDLRKLGGLWRAMPGTFIFTTIAALSMAGLPPLFGFLAKETLLATAIHPDVPAAINFIFPVIIMASGIFLLGQSGVFVYGTFLGKAADPKHPPHGHEPPFWMLLAPAIPAVLSLALGLLPEPGYEAQLLAQAASAAYGDKVKVSLVLWNGLNVELLLSIIVISLGSVLFLARRWVRTLEQAFLPQFTINRLYEGFLRSIDWMAGLATRLQNGSLRFYLSTMLFGLAALVLLFRALPLSLLSQELREPINLPGRLDLLRLFVLGLAALSGLASVALRRDLYAILTLSISGLAVAIWFALEPAPDVALVQIIVDLLATVILVLSLSRLPRLQREAAQDLGFGQKKKGALLAPGVLRDGTVAVLIGGLVAALTYISLSIRPHISLVTPFYVANAKTMTGAKDIVGAILTDFRGFDTLFEIVVFAGAGLGIHMLLHYASRKAGDQEDPDPKPPPPHLHPATGVAGFPTSPLLHLLANAILPLSILLAVIQMMYGHDQPGDGFTAGVFVSLAIGFWYVIFGYHASKEQLTWVRSGNLIGAGLLLALLNGFLGITFGKGFFSPVNYGSMLNLPLPVGFNLSNSFIFEVAIFLTVLGSATYILDNLGRPKELDLESDSLLRVIEKEVPD
jgi:multicomponent K+:H+ antiporter subunit A